MRPILVPSLSLRRPGKLGTTALVLLTMLGGVAYAQEADLLVHFTADAAKVTVSVEAVAAAPLPATAEVLIRKQGPMGSATSSQSTALDIGAGQRQVVAVFATNLPAGHTIEVAATLRSGERVLKEVSATYP